MNSMTAFGASSLQAGNWAIHVEMRSVNHRYLEMSFRLPESIRALEPELRLRQASKLKRGKVECQIRISQTGGEIALHHEGIRALIDTAERVSSTYGVPYDLTVSKLLAWPGLSQTEPLEDKACHQEVLHCFEKALLALSKARAEEGRKLKVVLMGQVDLLKTEISKARTEAHVSTGMVQDKLKERLKALEVEVERQRIEQELALLITKMDVVEELDRLVAHTDEFARILQEPQTHGKRLDFILQELNREANTLCSKSNSILLTRMGVEMKVLIEQMREQIQNIE